MTPKQIREFFIALDELEREKGVDKQSVLSSLETALAVACKKHYGEASNIVVKADAEKQTIHFYTSKVVVEEVEVPEKEISLTDAREIKKKYKIGDIVERKIDDQIKDFGRVAAQNARQVIVNSLHNLQKDMALSQFSEKENELVVGVVNRLKFDGSVFVEIGQNQLEGILSVSEQIPGESYKIGDRVKVLVKRVRDSVGGIQVMLSRTNAAFITKLFEAEVPEIRAGIVEVKAVVREAGFRTKIAVYSNDPDVDAVGACVGNKGIRVNAIVSEINGEKIDIIPWSEDILDYIARALSPAKVLIVQADEENREAKVVVPDEKLSLAIGKEGQNARLAAKLTGWKIDVKSYTVAMQSGMFDDGDETSYEEEPTEQVETDALELDLEGLFNEQEEVATEDEQN